MEKDNRDEGSRDFIESVLSDLEGQDWVKHAITEGLAHDPGEACDGARLIYECMKMRANEASGPPFDDDPL